MQSILLSVIWRAESRTIPACIFPADQWAWGSQGGCCCRAPHYGRPGAASRTESPSSAGGWSPWCAPSWRHALRPWSLGLWRWSKAAGWLQHHAGSSVKYAMGHQWRRNVKYFTELTDTHFTCLRGLVFFSWSIFFLLITCSIGDAVSSSSSVPFLWRWASSSPSSNGMLRMRARKWLKIMSVLRTSSLNQTIPQRDTVARVAYFKSCTSNMTRT